MYLTAQIKQKILIFPSLVSVLDKIEGCLGKYNYKAHEWWSFVFSMFRVQWVVPERVVDLLFGWGNWLGKFVVFLLGIQFPYACCEQYQRRGATGLFKEVETLVVELKLVFLRSLFEWSCILGNNDLHVRLGTTYLVET